MMQGGNFVSGAFSGMFGSLGASGFGAVAGDFAKTAEGIVLSGAVLGGVGSELTGGNFWQGALIGGVVAGLNHVAHSGDMEPDNGYDKNGKKINNDGGDMTDYIYDDKGNVISHTSVTISTTHGGEISSYYEAYGMRLRTIGTGGALYDPSFDIAITEIGGGLVFKGLGLGLKYFNTATGGLKQWIRMGSSYSIEGGFKTYSTRWGAGGNHWKKIGNSTLQNWNRSFRQTKLPGNNWRVQDPGHFHWWKK